MVANRKTAVSALLRLTLILPISSRGAETSTPNRKSLAAATKEESGSSIKPAISGSADAPLVKVTIASSRTEVSGNGAYGIFADLANLASVPLTLYPQDTQHSPTA